MIVVDSNVLAARMLSCESTNLALSVEAADSIWLVPRLWRYEFLNILATQIKAGRIKQSAAHAMWQRLASLLEENESDPAAEQVLELVAKHRITAYDAHFVALARVNACLLVTEDVELQRKFPDLAVSMKSFVSNKGLSGWVRETSATYGKRKRPIDHSQKLRCPT